MTLLHLATAASTMDTARQILDQGDTQTTIILADQQTAGRGRHNRPWITFDAPHGMAATFILRGEPIPHLPLLVALALYQAVETILPTPDTRNPKPDTRHPTPLRIKWPNDLLLNGKKAAGILCENITYGAGGQASLVGIGLNITPPARVPESFLGTFLNPQNPSNLAPKTLATSIWSCIQPLLTLYATQGWTSALSDSYVQCCATIGQTIVWQRGQPHELTGYARSLTKDGHLELVADDGTVHVIHSGEIFDKR